MSGMDDLIRRAAGRTAEPAPSGGTDEPRRTSFDGGARDAPPPPGPSMDGLLRAAREESTADRAARAHGIDHHRKD